MRSNKRSDVGVQVCIIPRGCLRCAPNLGRQELNDSPVVAFSPHDRPRFPRDVSDQCRYHQSNEGVCNGPTEPDKDRGQCDPRADERIDHGVVPVRDQGGAVELSAGS